MCRRLQRWHEAQPKPKEAQPKQQVPREGRRQRKLGEFFPASKWARPPEVRGVPARPPSTGRARGMAQGVILCMGRDLQTAPSRVFIVPVVCVRRGQGQAWCQPSGFLMPYTDPFASSPGPIGPSRGLGTYQS